VRDDDDIESRFNFSDAAVSAARCDRRDSSPSVGIADELWEPDGSTQSQRNLCDCALSNECRSFAGRDEYALVAVSESERACLPRDLSQHMRK
jgi:hypothetical protein